MVCTNNLDHFTKQRVKGGRIDVGRRRLDGSVNIAVAGCVMFGVL